MLLILREKNINMPRRRLDRDRRERNLEPVCRGVVDGYMQDIHQDPGRVDSKKFNEDNKRFANLSKESYQTMKDSVDTPY